MLLELQDLLQVDILLVVVEEEIIQHLVRDHNLLVVVDKVEVVTTQLQLEEQALQVVVEVEHQDQVQVILVVVVQV